jgi:hypothetical protein
MFHLCSRGSRDARRSAELGLEGPHALRQRLSRIYSVHAEVRLWQLDLETLVSFHARAELPSVTARVAPHVSGLWKSEGDGLV